ncbi:hypothetical protein JXB02_00925 [Candidatus Woesearchaeota archaeon]|nr:hypothetical protein [Candidatus Woesearchaeota archaeon]
MKHRRDGRRTGRRGQVWYGDYIIATVMFVLMVLIYYEFSSNLSQEEETTTTDILMQSKIVSNDLMSEGMPTGWNATDVQRFGLSTANRIDAKKMRRYADIPYEKTLYRFKTNYNHYMFLQDRDGNVRLIGGVCGAGHPAVNSTMSSYGPVAYYSRNGGDEHLVAAGLGLPLIRFNDSNITRFLENVGDYPLAVVEDPQFNASVIGALADYLRKGGNLVVTRRVLDNASGAFLDWRYVRNDSCGNENATVLAEDPFVDLSVGSSVRFTGCPHIEGGDGLIAGFLYNESHAAIASWRYGNGWVYYFSDFSLQGQNGSLPSLGEELVMGLSDGRCTQPDYASLDPDNLISSTRFITHRADILKMVVYLWRG